MVLVARFNEAYGVKGEIKINFFFDEPKKLQGITLFAEHEDTLCTLADIREYNKGWLAKVEGITGREELKLLAGSYLYANRHDLPVLPEDKYYSCDIIGLQVSENGLIIGKICDVIFTGSNEVYVAELLNGHLMNIPALRTVVRSISVKNNIMDITDRNVWQENE